MVECYMTRRDAIGQRTRLLVVTVELTPAELRREVVRVRVVVALYPRVSVRAERHRAVPRVEPGPPSPGLFDLEALVVCQRRGHALEKRRERDVHERQLLAEKIRAGRLPKLRVDNVHSFLELASVPAVRPRRRQPSHPARE
eukprot:30888-Pelagococcus_subviridis.AAC.2